MSHVLHYGNNYFRVDVIEVTNPDEPNKPKFVSWCSDAFRELKECQATRCRATSPARLFSNHADALRHADDWIKSEWDTNKGAVFRQRG